MVKEVKTSIPTLPEGVKKPNNPYFLFSNEVREAVLKEEKCWYFEAGKHIKERWDKLSEEKKKDYQKSSEEQKKTWDEFLQSDEGKAYQKAEKELKDEKEKKAELVTKKLKRDEKKAGKAQSGTSGTKSDRCIDGVRSPFSDDWFSKWLESGTRVPPRL